MTSNIEVNAAASQVVIVDQAIAYAKTEYPADKELMEMLTDMRDSARRFLGWLRFLQECQQKVKATYTEYIGKYFREAE